MGLNHMDFYKEYLKITSGFTPEKCKTPEEQAEKILRDSMIKPYISKIEYLT